MIIVSLDSVTFSYGARTVLDGLCWQVQAGQKVGLVGPNGAGKSTLLRLVAGELAPERGNTVRDRNARAARRSSEAPCSGSGGASRSLPSRSAALASSLKGRVTHSTAIATSTTVTALSTKNCHSSDDTE